MLFPARAGINLMQYTLMLGRLAVPRTGGDKPRGQVEIEVNFICSPHGRG